MPFVLASSTRMKGNHQCLGSVKNPTPEDLLTRVAALESSMDKLLMSSNARMDALMTEVKKENNVQNQNLRVVQHPERHEDHQLRDRSSSRKCNKTESGDDIIIEHETVRYADMAKGGPSKSGERKGNQRENKKEKEKDKGKSRP